MSVSSKAVGKFGWSIAAAESDSVKEEKLHALYLSNGEWNNVLLQCITTTFHRGSLFTPTRKVPNIASTALKPFWGTD